MKSNHQAATAPNRIHFGNKRLNNHGIIEKPRDMKKTLKQLVEYFYGFKHLLGLLVVAVLVVTGTSLLAPSIQGSAIDAIKAGEWEYMRKLLVVLIFVYLVHALCTLMQTLISARLSQKISQLMRNDLCEKINRLSIPYLDTHSNGDIMSRMINDVENVATSISQSLGSLFSGLLTIVGTIVIMFVYCWQLTLITMITVVMTVITTKLMSKMMSKAYRKRSIILGQLNGHSEEMITGYKSVTAYEQQEQVIGEFNELSEELKKVSIIAESMGNSMGPIMSTLANIGFVIVSAFGGYFALTGLITIGTISAFIIYAKQFSRPIHDIAQLYGSLQTAVAGAERIFELLECENEDNRGTLAMDQTQGAISFKNVNFSYVPEKQVLHEFSLDIKPGQKIALVGATGSGKTTIVNLLMRFYNIDSGDITIDEKSIYDIRRDDLRKSIAIVLQDTVLFSESVGYNIKYASPDASKEKMINAANMSNSAYFIDKLQKGYDTFLTHAGAKLSHGQRQLLAIARAVMADPKILILDEATSSIDTKTEKQIQDAMVNLMKNRTSLIIAHRLSTIQDADIIVVMDKGRVVETGNHAELLKKQGYYYSLYMEQFAGSQT